MREVNSLVICLLLAEFKFGNNLIGIKCLKEVITLTHLDFQHFINLFSLPQSTQIDSSNR
jgi:uncharacterized FlgJ-related protein